MVCYGFYVNADMNVKPMEKNKQIFGGHSPPVLEHISYQSDDDKPLWTTANIWGDLL